MAMPYSLYEKLGSARSREQSFGFTTYRLREVKILGFSGYRSDTTRVYTRYTGKPQTVNHTDTSG